MCVSVMLAPYPLANCMKNSYKKWVTNVLSTAKGTDILAETTYGPQI